MIRYRSLTRFFTISTTSEFVLGQNTFFQSHCAKFSDDDENKLEHTNLHKEYITICKDAIDALLNDKYGEDIVKAFYTDIAPPNLFCSRYGNL